MREILQNTGLMNASAPPPSSRSSASIAAAVLLAVAAAALLLRIPSIAQPLGIDQGLWASAVRGMSRGQRLYQDVWEQRPPGIYWIYLAGFNVLGWRAATVAWLDLMAAAIATAAIWGIARTLSGSLTAALAVMIYATMTMPAWLYRHGGFLERSVSETFIVVCVSLAALCAVRWRVRPSLILAAGVGLFAGAAVVLKPNAGLYFPAMVAWMLLYRPRHVERRDMIRAVAAAIGASAILPIVTLIWLARLGLMDNARVAVIEFNRFYVSQGFTLGGYALDFSKALFLRMKTEPLWLAGSVGGLAAVWQLATTRRLPPLAGLTVIWGAAAFCMIVVNGVRLFNSYFIPPMVPLSLLAAWLFTDWVKRSGVRKGLAGVVAVLMVGLLVQRGYAARILDTLLADIAVLRGSMDRTAYLERFGGYANDRGYSGRSNAELAAYVREHTSPDDRVYLFGINGAEVYFAADRLTAHRFLRVNFFVDTEFPDPQFRLDAVVRDLAARRPRYIIFERLHSTSAMARAADALIYDPLVAELLSTYQLEAQVEDFALYRRVE
jgi:4-amino-4-deoxy-L-arabinose transferase-like glycosyltransferase